MRGSMPAAPGRPDTWGVVPAAVSPFHSLSVDLVDFDFHSILKAVQRGTLGCIQDSVPEVFYKQVPYFGRGVACDGTPPTHGHHLRRFTRGRP